MLFLASAGGSPVRHARPGFQAWRWLGVLAACATTLAGAAPGNLPARAPTGQFGRASLSVIFPEGKIGQREPLMVSAGGHDVLFVWYSGKDQIRIGYHHVGDGGPVSEPIRIEPGRAYALELNLGGFYPPALDHPAYAGRSGEQAGLLRKQLVVLMDDQLVLKHTANFDASNPEDVHFGENPGPYVAPGRFSGTLQSIRRHGIAPPMNLLKPGGDGPVRLRVRFPAFTERRTEPLVSTGRPTAGDLFYVTYVAPGLIRFGHDSWNAGSVETTDVAYKPEAVNILELKMPALSAPEPGAATGRFILRFNGTVLMADERPYHASAPADPHFGLNTCESSAAQRAFTGEIEHVERMDFLSLSSEKFQTDPGPVRLVLKFPANVIGRTEPLLITGHREAGDILYVHYVDGSHVVFGYDHWSKGGPLSAPIPVDYSATHTVEIQVGSLFPAEGEGGAPALPASVRDTVMIKLNGRTVFTHQEAAYPSTPAEILIGLNTIGATTCERLFTGRIFHRERLGPAPLAP
jgi:hypothetical protein